MKREPFFLLLLRYLFPLGIFFFMGMLYWSSLLVEEELQAIKRTLLDLKAAALRPPHSSVAPTTQKEKDTRLPGDEKYANLLNVDAFYTATLPKLLGDAFMPHGTFQQATIGRPDNLHPFSNWSNIVQWHNLCTTAIASMHIGIYETMAPGLALKIEERPIENTQETEFWVYLRDDLYWEPLNNEQFAGKLALAEHFYQPHRVTAYDLHFYVDALLNPHVEQAGAIALRSYYSDIDQIEVIDDFTLRVRWKNYDVKDKSGKIVKRPKYQAKSLTGNLKPLPSFVYKYFTDGSKIVEDDSSPTTYRNSAVWAYNFSNHWARNIIVSCGPWVFEAMNENHISFRRNNNYFRQYAALANGSTVYFKETNDAIWQQFKNGQLDSYSLQPDQIGELETFKKSALYREQKDRGLGIERLDYLSLSYNYIGWNMRNPLFANKKVRQALTMAIDRERIIADNLNGMGVAITSPFSPNSTAYDKTLKPWPFDLEKARRFLSEEGWYDSDGDGIIDKEIDGKHFPFSFTLTYYVKNETIKAICEYVATALRQLSIECKLNGVDIADLSSAFDDKAFDAICLGWALGSPPEDPKQLWHSSGAALKGSSNAVGFSSAEADALIEALQYEVDPIERQALYHRFDAIIYEGAPYTFLYAPKVAFLYREHLKNVFVPIERQDLIPGADVAQPNSSIFWISQN